MTRPFVYITPELPWPPNQGSRRFLLETGRSLAKLGPVHWISRRTPGSEEAESVLRREGFDLDLDPAFSSGGVARLCRRLKSEWLAARRRVPREEVFVSSRGVCARVASWAKLEPEAVYVGAYWSTGRALAHAPRARRVLIAADVESVARCEVGTPDELERLRNAETGAFRSSDLLLTLSWLDAAAARELLRSVRPPDPVVGVWPVTIDVPARPVRRLPRAMGPVFLCYGHWKADFNRDGLRWFLEEIWPSWSDHPLRPRLRVVGAGLTKRERPVAEGIEWVGYVEDIEAEFRRCDGVLIPLRWAGGVRYRLLEAQARGLTVLCTHVAAAGSGSKAGCTHIEAEGPASFCCALDQWRDPLAIATIGDRAHAFVRRRYGRDGSLTRVKEALAPVLYRQSSGVGDRIEDVRRCKTDQRSSDSM